MECLLTLVLVLTPATFDEEPTRRTVVPDEGLTLEGVALDPGGAPAAGARVVLSTRSVINAPFSTNVEVFGDEQTDAAGEFRLEVPERWARRSDYRTLDLWILAEGAALSLVSYHVEDVPAGERITIRLTPRSTSEIAVKDEEGRSVADAAILPRTYPYSSVPETLAEELTVRTNASGVARVEAWDPARVQAIVVTAERNGRQVVHGEPGWLSDEDVPLRPAGTVVVEHVGEAPTLPSGQLVLLRSFSGSGSPTDGPSAYGELDVALSPGSSPAVFPLAAGSLNPFVELTRPLDRLPVISGGSIEGGETFSLKIEWRPGIPVTGRVVDAETGEGIEGAVVHVTNDPLRFPVTSGPDGRLSFRALSGRIAVSDVVPPPPFNARRGLSSETMVRVPSEA